VSALICKQCGGLLNAYPSAGNTWTEITLEVRLHEADRAGGEVSRHRTHTTDAGVFCKLDCLMTYAHCRKLAGER